MNPLALAVAVGFVFLAVGILLALWQYDRR